MDKFLIKTKLSASAAASTATSTSEIAEALLARHNRRKRKAESIELGEKSCNNCEKIKSYEEFPKGRTICKSCNLDVRKKCRKISPLEKAQKREAMILHMDTHKCSDHEVFMPKCLKCRQIYSRAQCKRQRAKPIFQAQEKMAKIEKRYIGLDHIGYKKLLDEQNSKCDICPLITDDLVGDHHHSTLKVRALLCPKCNRGIGLFRENVEVLNKVIEYLKRSENL